ncbi:hypothetical protein N7492_010714 [Penicillium capsulatum]|uniref:Uncharacterized protein n=1 Tax=Penicillium capsulatum TaxID=69766 RepID=A0A9W9LDN8_9EURO|nr:hypothetical protein N7492_010714 [Penicillium capsulatum]
MTRVQGVPIVEMGPSPLLSMCQRFFSTKIQEFHAAAVYVVIKDMSGEYIFDKATEDELRFEIGYRLNDGGVFKSEEGSLIRIALALEQQVWMKIQDDRVFDISSPDIPEREVVLKKFQPLFSVHLRPTGLYRVEITVVGFSQPISKSGTVTELANLFRLATRERCNCGRIHYSE